MHRNILWLVMIALWVLALPTTYAQDFTEEELALLQRFVDANDYLIAEPVYILQSEEDSFLDLNVMQDGELIQTQINSETRSTELSYLSTDPDNIAARQTVIVEESSTTNDERETTIINGTLVYVEGRLFAAAAYDTASPDRPFGFPQTGFIELVEPETPTAYDVLNPTGFLDDIGGVEDEGDLEFTLELLQETVRTIEVTEIEHNGETLEQVTITLDGEGLVTLYESSAEPIDDVTLVLFNQPGAIGEFSISIDDKGVIQRTRVSVVTSGENIDFTTLNPNSPPGITFNFTLNLEEVQTIVTRDPAQIDPISIPPGID